MRATNKTMKLLRRCSLAVPIASVAVLGLTLMLSCAGSSSDGTDPLMAEEVLHELKSLPRPYTAFLSAIQARQNYFKNYGSNHNMEVDSAVIRVISSNEHRWVGPSAPPADGYRVFRFADGKGPLDVVGSTGGLCWGGWAQSESGLFKTGRWSVYVDVDESIIGYYFDRFDTWNPENGEE